MAEAEGKGFGVVALSPLKKGTFICEYVGEVISHDDYKIRKARHRDAYIIGLGTNNFVDAFQYGNISRFFNHSCRPNAVAEECTVHGKRRIAFMLEKESRPRRK